MEFKVELPGTDELTAHIVDAVANTFLHESEYRHGIRAEVSSKVIELLYNRLDQEVLVMVQDVLAKPVQPTNEFGEPTGDAMTLKARVAQQVQKFLEEKVDRDGNIYSKNQIHYSSREYHTRAEWAIQNAVKEIAQAELANAVKAAANEVRSQVGEAVQKSVAETVKRVLSLP